LVDRNDHICPFNNNEIKKIFILFYFSTHNNNNNNNNNNICDFNYIHADVFLIKLLFTSRLLLIEIKKRRRRKKIVKFQSSF
jgi:hypothetical protein